MTQRSRQGSERPEREPVILGVDTGGTFTDFVLLADGELRTLKRLSTPEAPEEAILEGLEDLGLRAGGFRLCHGSTVATNAVLEGRGGRVAFITNRGFGDLLAIGRQQRRELYRLSVPPRTPPVPADHCLETGGRLAADGRVVTALSADELRTLVERLDELAPDAVAVCLLHAYLDDRFERAIGAALSHRWPVSLSSEVLAEIGEYERAIATWLNAYVAPRMGAYLRRLGQAVHPAPVSVMQSDGLRMAAEQAADRGVRLLLSGPAGGLVGALGVSGQRRLMTLDVGGTSTDVALLDGEIALTREGRIGPYPVAVPMVDLHTVGAGGGSLARVDAAGLLHVGPESAGAAPGPACYGLGGTAPTVTDAMVAAGRMPDGARLGRDGPALSRALAVRALAPLGRALGRSGEEAAAAVIRLANEHMAAALRVISVERGFDPAQFVLCGFGGAGGLHLCELAELLGMSRALRPAHAGVLSALGMAFAAPGRESTRAVLTPLRGLSDALIAARLGAMAETLEAELAAEGVAAASRQHWAELRYRGQSFTLSLPWTDLAGTEDAFRQAHQRRFGHTLDAPVELVSLRVGVRGPARAYTLHAQPEVRVHAPGTDSGDARGLRPRESLRGPASVMDTTGACWIAPGWEGTLDESGNLHLRKAE